MFRHLLTEETELRLLEPQYAGEMFTLIDNNRAHLRQWFSWVDDCQSVEDRRELLKRKLVACGEHGSIMAGIWYSGALAGVVGVNPVHAQNRGTSLFYWLAESFQGKGLVTQACTALIPHAFTALQAHRIEIHAATENRRSPRRRREAGIPA